MANVNDAGLGAAEIDGFIDHGFLKLDQAFDPDLARRGRDELWTAMGLSPDDPATWTQPVVRLGSCRGPSSSRPPIRRASMPPMMHWRARGAG